MGKTHLRMQNAKSNRNNSGNCCEPGLERSGGSVERRKLWWCFFRWRLSAESRYAITYEAGAGEKTSETVIQKIFDELPVP